MMTVFKRFFPSVFSGTGDDGSSSTTEVPGQQPGSNEFVKQPGDERIMGEVKDVDGHLVTTFKPDGGQAHPVWARSVAAETARKKRGWFFHT